MPPAQQCPDLHIPRLGPAPARYGERAAAPPDPKTDAPSVFPWLAKRIALLVLGILVLALAFSVSKNAFTGFLLLVFPFCCVCWVLNTGAKLFGWRDLSFDDLSGFRKQQQFIDDLRDSERIRNWLH